MLSDSGVAPCQSLLTNKLDVRSELHVQVSLVVVNQICVLHEAMNGCKKSKDLLKDCFENVTTGQPHYVKLAYLEYTAYV